ncbi:MAG: A/G-specific adenine glycosylase [Lentimicrobiaceae bacterium]|jgi:A/G-specific adenine glycosylase
MTIAESLLQWYSQNKRPLPWRETRDPYKIWLSEVILQQTRVAQGTDYYHRFLVAFPDVQSLAAAAEQNVLKLWQGLGYYSRARNMHFTAKEVVEKYNGIFPGSSAELKKLKGIGDYTAAAITSICFEEPTAVLDGNVARVISRLYAIDTPVDSNEGRYTITNLANNLLDTNHPGTFNQAVMELGALVCTPQSPACNTCPLAFACEALKRNQIENFPVKTPKKTPTVRHLNYLVISFKKDNTEYVLMHKRTGNDIWKNMYDFPCIESGISTDTTKILETCIKSGMFGGLPFVVKHVSGEYIHQLSHRRLLAKFIRIEVQGTLNQPDNHIVVSKNQIAELPIPRLIDRYLAPLI